MNMEYSLEEKQKWSLQQKIDHTVGVIEQFYTHFQGSVFIAFSGGKDSTVLVDIARKVHPEIPLVFVDTGLEFPEITQFVRGYSNVTILRPKKTFYQVIKEKGIPYPSKEVCRKVNDIRYGTEKLKELRLYGNEKGNLCKLSEKWKFLVDTPYKYTDYCCEVLKKRPSHLYQKESGRFPIVGTMACESSLRKMQYQKNGCNILSGVRPISKPLSIWKESDIWEYLKKYKIKYSPIYDMGYTRTGCMFCLFGIHYEHSGFFDKNRLERMKETHPKIYKYMLDVLEYREFLQYHKINF